MNEERASWVEADVASYMRTTNNEIDPPQVLIGDMICELLHWLEIKTGESVQVVHAARAGVSSYLAESELLNPDDHEIGPDVVVTIRAVSEGEEFSFLAGNVTERQPILDGS